MSDWGKAALVGEHCAVKGALVLGSFAGMAGAAVAACPLEETQRKSQPGESGVKKRNMNPGRFLRGGRIYDSELGQTCHWCRQKTVEHHVRCSRCTIKFCGSCLSNRNGEDILQEMLENVLWVCPKCRGGCGAGCANCCNCGPCRIAQGLGPTGPMIRTAKAAGFTNVHDFLVHKITGESQDVIAGRKLCSGWTWGGGALVPLHTPTESSLKRKSLARKEGPSKRRIVEGSVLVNVKCELSAADSPLDEDVARDEDSASPSAGPSNMESEVDEDEDGNMKFEPLCWHDDGPTIEGRIGWTFSWETKRAESHEQEESGDRISAVKLEQESDHFTSALKFQREGSFGGDYANCSRAEEIKREESSELEGSEDCSSEASDQVETQECSATLEVKREETPEPEESTEWTYAFQVKTEWLPERKEFENCTGILEVKKKQEEFGEILEKKTMAQQGTEDCNPDRDVEGDESPHQECEGCISPPDVKREESPEEEEWMDCTSGPKGCLPSDENSEHCPSVRLLGRKNSEMEASSELEESTKCAGEDGLYSFAEMEAFSEPDESTKTAEYIKELTGVLRALGTEHCCTSVEENNKVSEDGQHPVAGSPTDVVLLEDEDQDELQISASRSPLKPQMHDCKCIPCAPKDHTVIKSSAVITLSDSDSDTRRARSRVKSLTTPPRKRFHSRNLRDSLTSSRSKRSARIGKVPKVSQHSGPPTCLSGNEFQQKLEVILRESFNEQELKDKMELVTHRKPMEKERQMRQRSIPFKSAQQGLSYLDHYPEFAKKLSAARDDEEKLTLLRGFFFYIQYPMLQGAFAPWTREPESNADSDDCVEVGPDCEILAVCLPVGTRKNARRSLKFGQQLDKLKTVSKKTGPFRLKVESEIPRLEIPFV